MVHPPFIRGSSTPLMCPVPPYSSAQAVADEADPMWPLAAVKPPDCVTQPFRGHHSIFLGKRVVKVRRPLHLLKCRKHQRHDGGRSAKPFHHLTSHAEF